MTEADLAQQLARAGYKVHFSRDVWWQGVGVPFAKPVNPLRTIRSGESRPAFGASFLGYSHAVADPASANRFWPVMRLNQEALAAFRLDDLRKGRRSSIRKALRELEFRAITDLEVHMSTIAEICASQAARTGHGRSPSYYNRHARVWSRFMRREFSIPSREWLGAYLGSRLIAYYYAYMIDTTLYISAAKSHTDVLRSCPNDGLLYSLIERYKARPDCRQVIFGDWSADNESLNAFKESFGFERWDVPIYRHARWPMRLGLWARANARRWRA